MSYKINKTDGTLLVDLVDGRIDTDSTDVTLFGKNYTGYGEFLNENFIKILENFANAAPPANPLAGQLWYDTTEGRLKVFNGTFFRSTDTTVVSPTEPQLLAGDIWIDSANRQIKFSDGAGTILAGPIYTAAQGITGFDVVTYNDRFGNSRVVARIMINNFPVAIISRIQFEMLQDIPNFGRTIRAGINISDQFPDFQFRGNSTTASSIVDGLGNPFTAEQFLRTTTSNTTTGLFHVKNDGGLTVGDDSDFRTLVSGTDVIQRVQLSGSNYKVQVRQGFDNIDALVINNTANRVGIFQSSPQATLDVGGDVRVTGNLTVLGTTTTIETNNLTVEDKLIEIAATASGPLGDDTVADGAGIRVRSSISNKDWIWSNTFDSWTASCGINIPTSYSYKINGFDVLSTTTLGNTVTTALGLTQIGTLAYLDVDNININNTAITSSLPLQINSNGEITINNQKIVGVVSPDVSDPPDTVATKGYVDDKLENQDVSLYLDITGLTDAQVALVLNDLYPAIVRNTGIYAYVHCVVYTGMVPARSLKRFIINGSNQWVFESNLASSV